MSTTPNDSWGVVAPAYVQVERLTTPPCQSLLNRVCRILPLDSADATAFDNGCGTGVLTSLLKQQYPQTPLLATDASEGMIEILQHRIEDHKWEAVTARVVDSRDLSGIENGNFTHTFSTFMVCLAPEPEKIVREMWRVTKEGGVLGLAVWADPRFGSFFTPWEKACRRLIADYEPPAVMGADWTLGEKVRAGLEKAGFRDVEVWEEDLSWRWESAEALSGYFFDGGNPANLRVIDSFRAHGGNVDEARAMYERIVEEECGQNDGLVEVHISATLATARK